MSETPHIVICRRASDPVTPGSVRGFSCGFCGLALIATPAGARYIQQGSKPVCNSCGLQFSQMLAEQMKLDPTKGAEVIFTPEAQAQARRMGVDIEQWCREKGVPLERRPCEDPDK